MGMSLSNVFRGRTAQSFLVPKGSLSKQRKDLDFEEILDLLRPTPLKVEATYQYEGDEVGAMIYADGSLRHVIDPAEINQQAFQEEVERLVDFYRNPPRLWPGCRGAVARFLGRRLDRDFNRWFDEMASKGKGVSQ